jgi:hypothetical protein
MQMEKESVEFYEERSKKATTPQEKTLFHKLLGEEQHHMPYSRIPISFYRTLETGFSGKNIALRTAELPGHDGQKWRGRAWPVQRTLLSVIFR